MGLLATFGLILICCHALVIETESYPAYQDPTMLEKFLDGKLREMLKNGDETIGLPRLDPFIKDELPINLKDENIKLDALLTKVDVRGLAGYDVNNGDFALIGMKLNANLTWPLIYGVTNYTLDAIIGDGLTIYGTGKINLAIEKFNFNLELSLTTKDTSLEVKSVDADFNLGSFSLKITGLFNDEEISEVLSAVITDMVPQLIQDYKPQIKEVVHSVITDVANDFLSNKTISDIIDIIS